MRSAHFFEHKVAPYKYAAVILAGMLSFLTIYKFLCLSAVMSCTEQGAWIIVGSFLLLFVSLNPVLAIPFDNQNRYFLYSVLWMVVLMILGALLAWVFSGLSLLDSIIFQKLYVVFFLCELIFLGISRFIRRMVKITQKNDRALRGENKNE